MMNSGQGRVIRESNLDRFMKNTIPIVRTQHLPQENLNGSAKDESYKPYFVLGDVWDSFSEWSAYGTGAAFVSSNNDIIEQFYTPHLSGMQLYVDPSTPLSTVRWSEGSFGDVYNDSDLSSIDEDVYPLEPCKPENNVDDSIEPGLLAFEFFEQVLPFTRSTLAERAIEISVKFPKLLTYRSCDLTPSSWFSVTWKPLIGIPIGTSNKTIKTFFMTFHSLSTPLRGSNGNASSVGDSTVSLPSFRFAAARFRSSEWTHDAVHGLERMKSMMHSTDNWLIRMNIKHPDFICFKNNAFLR